MLCVPDSVVLLLLVQLPLLLLSSFKYFLRSRGVAQCGLCSHSAFLTPLTIGLCVGVFELHSAVKLVMSTAAVAALPTDKRAAVLKALDTSYRHPNEDQAEVPGAL